MAVARVDDIPPGHAARVEINEVPVAVFHVNGDFHAIDDTCTHAEASLSDRVHRTAIAEGSLCVALSDD